jgi:hypothetical protein
MIDPVVQGCEHMAVLTYNAVNWVGERESRWNVTEVYRKTGAVWRIASSHFSRIQSKMNERPPEAANPQKEKP